VIDDDGGGIEAASVIAELDLFVAQVDGGFVVPGRIVIVLFAELKLYGFGP
jgi:hypothetical protein